MTICTGCSMETTATICCPICLKYNKSIFYCSQECYEVNYKDHKKMHYFIKKAINTDIHKKIHEINETSTIKHELPVVILSSEGEKNEQLTTQNIFPTQQIYTIRNSEYGKEGKEEQNNENKNNQHVVQNGKNSLRKSLELYTMGSSMLYENKQRKKKCKNSYEMLAGDMFPDHKEDKEAEEQQQHEQREQIEVQKNREKVRIRDKGRSRERTGIREMKTSRNKTFAPWKWFQFLFSNKCNFVLPYYEDIELENRKNGSTEIPSKKKLTNQQYLELKQHLKKKRVAQLLVILTGLTVLIITVTLLFSHFLENAHNKNIYVWKKQMEDNNKNGTDTGGRDKFLEVESYISAIEELKKEIDEMKEILYVHNVYMQRHFNLPNSFNMFNSISKRKDKMYGKKKNEENLNQSTTFNFHKESAALRHSNDIADMENTQEEAEKMFSQSHYDVSDINELDQTKQSRKHVEEVTKSTDAVKELEEISKEEQLIMGTEEEQLITEADPHTSHDIKKNDAEWEVADAKSSFISKEERIESKNQENVQKEKHIKRETFATNGSTDKNNAKVKRKESISLNENLINQHEVKYNNEDRTFNNVEMDSLRDHGRGDNNKTGLPNDQNERKLLMNKMGKNKQQTI